MRSLADTRVLTRALLAAVVTSTACWPRLAQWPARSGSTLFFGLSLLGVAWVLWAFVFAWHSQYARRPVFNFKFQPKLWLAATLYALAAAAVGHYLVDPQLRPVAPAEFPTDMKSWLAMTLFALAFEPLFLCFAPFAFFIRLSRRIEVALALTVTFELFILALRLGSPPSPPMMLVVELLVLCVAGGFAGVWFYVRGGALLVWWVVLLLQLRYVVELAAGSAAPGSGRG